MKGHNNTAMSGYWARYQDRQRKLAAGVDAGLVRDNRKHYRFGWTLLSGAIVVMLLTNYMPLPEIIARVIVTISSTACIGGMIQLWLARCEERVINKPDPTKPPSIFMKQ
jgi:hypothetical protein